MAKQTINVGTNPNDGTGDTLRTAGQKINSNFTEVYNASQSAFDKGNSATVLAQAAYNYANTIVSDSQIDPYARVTANAGFLQANAAATLAQASFNYANTIVSDTQIDPYARVTANAGFNQANAAITLAQAAFDQANTGGGGSLPLANGTSNIDIALENGPVTLTANVFIMTLDDNNGSIDLPGNVTNFEACSAINFVPNSSGDGNGYSTIELRPDSNASADQYIIIDPTEGGHIHLRAGGTQDSSGATLFLGGEKNYVRVIDNQGLRLQNEYTTSNYNYYTENSQYVSGTWYEDSGNYFVRFTTDDVSMISDVTAFGNGSPLNEIIIEWYDGVGTVSNTMMSVSGYWFGVGNVYTAQVNSTLPANNTVLTAIAFEIFTTQTNFIIFFCFKFFL